MQYRPKGSSYRQKRAEPQKNVHPMRKRRGFLGSRQVKETKACPPPMGRAQAVENPLRGFPTDFCSLLRALLVRRGRTTRTKSSLRCIFRQVHAPVENDSNLICRCSGKFCEAFSTVCARPLWGGLRCYSRSSSSRWSLPVRVTPWITKAASSTTHRAVGTMTAMGSVRVSSWDGRETSGRG